MILADPVIFMCVVCIAPWLVAGWLRIPRYAAYFQQQNYDYEGYTAWFSSTKAENRYCLAFVIAILLSPVVLCSAIVFLANLLNELIFEKPILAAILYVAVVPLALCFAPRKGLKGQSLSLAPHTIRLLVTAFFVELILAVPGVILIQSAYVALTDPNNSPEAMGVLALPFFAFILLMVVATGPFVYIVTPYSLPIAQLLNWPINRFMTLIKPIPADN